MGFVAGLGIGVAAAAVLWLVVTYALVRSAAWRSMSVVHRAAGWLAMAGAAMLMVDSVLPLVYVTPIHNGRPFEVELGDWAFVVALAPTLLVLLWATTRHAAWQVVIGILIAFAAVPLFAMAALASISAETRVVAPQATGLLPHPELGFTVEMLACAVVVIASLLWAASPSPGATGAPGRGAAD